MKEGKEALTVKKMNSESKVRRCGQGAERGAQACGARLTLLGVGDRYTLPSLGPRSSERLRVPEREAAMSSLGEFFSSGIFPRGHVVCGCQAASLSRTPPSVVS